MTTRELEQYVRLIYVYYITVIMCVEFESIFRETDTDCTRLEKEKHLQDALNLYWPPLVRPCTYFWTVLFWKMFPKLTLAYYHNTHTARNIIRHQVFPSRLHNGGFRAVRVTMVASVARAFDNNNNNNINPVVPGKLIKNQPAAAVHTALAL